MDSIGLFYVESNVSFKDDMNIRLNSFSQTTCNVYKKWTLSF